MGLKRNRGQIHTVRFALLKTKAQIFEFQEACKRLERDQKTGVPESSETRRLPEGGWEMNIRVILFQGGPCVLMSCLYSPCCRYPSSGGLLPIYLATCMFAAEEKTSLLFVFVSFDQVSIYLHQILSAVDPSFSQTTRVCRASLRVTVGVSPMRLLQYALL